MVEIKHHGLSADGVPRHPQFLRRRDDRAAAAEAPVKRTVKEVRMSAPSPRNYGAMADTKLLRVMDELENGGDATERCLAKGFNPADDLVRVRQIAESRGLLIERSRGGVTAALAVVEDAPGVALVESAAPEPHTFPRLYARLVARDGSCPIESGVIGRLADNECIHERLPFDRTPACGCFPQEGKAVVPTHYIGPAYVSDFPRGAPAITSEEVDQLLDATVSTSNGNGNDASPEAPFGYKADGVTPRKRPYPDWLKDPQKLAAAAKKRSRSTTGRSSRANGRPAISNGEAGVLARTTREIESEEQRLAGIVRELRAQREQLVAELAQLDESVAAAEEQHAPLAAAVAALAKV